MNTLKKIQSKCLVLLLVFSVMAVSALIGWGTGAGDNVSRTIQESQHEIVAEGKTAIFTFFTNPAFNVNDVELEQTA